MVADEHEERALPGSPRGTLLSWGSNSAGQLGDGTTTNRATPAPVSGVRNVVSLAAGAGFVLAVLSNGNVVAWGSNSNGQLGDGTKEDRPTAQPVPGLRDVIAVAAGSAHSLALRANGELLAWGRRGRAGTAQSPRCPAERDRPPARCGPRGCPRGPGGPRRGVHPLT